MVRSRGRLGFFRALATRHAASMMMVLAIAAPAIAHAQQPASTPPSDTARADSLRADSVRALRRLSTVVVTGTRLSSVDERAPAQVEQVDLSRTIPGPDAIVQGLTDLPGVNLYDDQGSPLQPELEVRGFTVSPVVGSPQGVSVFLDGMRVNEPDAQEVNFDLLPMAAIDQASLVRGSNVLFGRNSLGGTILLTTRRGEATPEASVELGAGSFGEQIATVTAGGKADGVDGFFAATGMNETGWRAGTSANTRNFFATIGHQWGPSHDSGNVALSILYGHDRLYEAGSLPESYLAINPQINYTPGDFFAPEASALNLRGNDPVAGGILRATLFLRRNTYEQYNANVPPPNTDGFIGNVSGGVTTEWTRPFLIGAVPVGLTTGLEIQRDNVHFRLLNVGGGQPDSVTTLADVRQENLGAYIQAIVTVSPTVDVTAGVRDDYVHIPYVDDLAAADNGTNSYDRLSPELGATDRFTKDLKGYVAYKSGFRAPAPLELACASPSAPCSLPSALGSDPRLEPVSSNDYEAGFDFDPSPRTTLDINAFWTECDPRHSVRVPELDAGLFRERASDAARRGRGVRADRLAGPHPDIWLLQLCGRDVPERRPDRDGGHCTACNGAGRRLPVVAAASRAHRGGRDAGHRAGSRRSRGRYEGVFRTVHAGRRVQPAPPDPGILGRRTHGTPRVPRLRYRVGDRKPAQSTLRHLRHRGGELTRPVRVEHPSRKSDGRSLPDARPAGSLHAHGQQATLASARRLWAVRTARYSGGLQPTRPEIRPAVSVRDAPGRPWWTPLACAARARRRRLGTVTPDSRAPTPDSRRRRRRVSPPAARPLHTVAGPD